MNERVLILGSGGREHALAWHISRTGYEAYCAPGSDAMEDVAARFSFSSFEGLREQIEKYQIGQVIVGPEKYLAEGLVDFLDQAGIPCFGPTRSAAQLETDKGFAKAFCEEFQIPTARHQKVVSPEELEDTLSTFQPPYVIKASGLAAGKGVWIGSSKKDAVDFGRRSLQEHSSLIVEDYLEGEEISFFAMVDGDNWLSLGAAQDHKRLLENDEGPNTGGMGAYSPPPLFTPTLNEKIRIEIIEKTLEGLKTRGIYYRGFLFVGLMIVRGSPYVLEFNCRMGDPETQAIVTRLKTPLPDLIQSLQSGEPREPMLRPGMSLSIVVAAKGYPEKPLTGFELSKIDEPPAQSFIFHSGTSRKNGKWIATGGRLFSVNTHQPHLLACQNLLYPWLEKLPEQANITYRKDIGARAFHHLMKEGTLHAAS